MIRKFKLFESASHIIFAVEINCKKDYDNLMGFIEKEGIYRWPSGNATSFRWDPNHEVIYFLNDNKMSHSIRSYFDNIYSHLPLYSVEDYITGKIKTKKRKLNLDEDPFGEEDWGYVQEQNQFEPYDVFNIGDEIHLRGKVSGRDLTGMFCTISSKSHDTYTTNYNENGKCEAYRYSGIYYGLEIDLGGDKTLYWRVPPFNIVEFDERKNKIKRKTNFDIDPFGEENWGYEK